MDRRVKVFFLTGHDSYENLAKEECLFRQGGPGYQILFYRNNPCVVLGRFQNPWKEINLQYCHENHIQVARRFSGGGCVYQDLGCLNFSFMAPNEIYNQDLHLSILVDALQSAGLEVTTNKYLSLFVGEKKISGSAFKRVKNHSLHHGTLLLQSNLLHLQKCLDSSWEAIESIGTNSKPSKVMNINISFNQMAQKILCSFQKHYPCRLEIIYANQSSSNLYEKVIHNRAIPWIYGQTPKAILLHKSCPEKILKVSRHDLYLKNDQAIHEMNLTEQDLFPREFW